MRICEKAHRFSNLRALNFLRFRYSTALPCEKKRTRLQRDNGYFLFLFYVHSMQCQAFLISKYRTRGSEIAMISELRYFRRIARQVFAEAFLPLHTEARRAAGNCV